MLSQIILLYVTEARVSVKEITSADLRGCRPRELVGGN